MRTADVEAYVTELGFAVANVSGFPDADKDRVHTEHISEEPSQNGGKTISIPSPVTAAPHRSVGDCAAPAL
jgi:hypothetical protein